MRLLPLTVPLLFLPLASAATGGPDGGGIVYTDSAEPLGPAHRWLDADEDAWPLADDATVTIDLPFAFTFYGTAYEEATVSSNGVLFFEGARTAASGACPGADPTWTGIAAYWDDLAAAEITTATVGTWPSRTFVVSWDGVAHGTAGGSGRFQIWLLEGRNEAVVVLDDTDWGDPAHDHGTTAVIGTNGPDGGTAYSCDAIVTDGTTAWFGDTEARPGREQFASDDLDAPWTGHGDFAYAGRTLGTGDINGDGVDDLLVGTQDRVAGEVALVYRPGVPDTLVSADATFQGQVLDDDFGAALATGDLDGDGQDELIVGAPGYDEGSASRAGKVYLWEGGSLDGTIAAADADATWVGPATGTPMAGSALATGDLNGDGYLDLVVGAPTADTSATDAGAIYVEYGAGLPSGSASLSAADVILLGVDPSDQLGSALATGDLDGDGADDLVVSALYADDGATNAGTVYLVDGASLASGAIGTAAICSFSTFGAGGELGASLLLADVDGSGLLDLFVGGPTEDGSRSDAGKAYGVYDAGLTCVPAANLADTTITGTATSANVGGSLASGDLDGDGTDDLVIGAPNMNLEASGGGVAYVFTTAPIGSVDATTAQHAIAGSGSAAALGTGLVVASNGSGVPTLLASAPYDSVSYVSEGAVYRWSYRPDFLDDDGDGFVADEAGGNDCDDADDIARPDGTDTPDDSVDGDCDGWVDGVVRVRDDAEGWAWDLAALGGGSVDTYGFESYGEGADIAVYADLAFAGDLTAYATVYGTAAVGTRGARLLPGTTNTVGIAFTNSIDGLAIRVLDPDDAFTLVATGASGTVVSGYTFALSGDDRTGGVYRGFVFADEVTAITLTGATTDGFGLDALEVAWASESDRDGDGWSEAEGDCDDGDAAVAPDADEDLSDGVDNDCDGIVDGGDAVAYTDVAAWTGAAALASTATVDFEIVGNGETIQNQYFDQGVVFGVGFVGGPDIDGTPAHGGMAAEQVGTSTLVTFDEEQPAIGFYVLDATDSPLLVSAWQDGILLYSTSFAPTSGDAFYGLVFDEPVDQITLSSATSWGLDDLVYSSLGLDDADGDGVTEREGDCDDTDPDAYEGAPDEWYDGVDADCAGDDDYDADRDGSGFPGDCDDEDPATHPDASEVWYDGVDSDCDGLSDYDGDRDGHDDIAFGGLDCDDADGEVSPEATEVWYDGVDQDCAGDDDDDADGDGFPIDTGSGLMDCDDTDATVSPGAAEVYYDGVDSDCGGELVSDYDADGDGWDAVAWGGGDCEDAEPNAWPGAEGEVCYDGVDTDCGGEDDNDCDGDGYASDAHGGDDCDDGDVAVNPAATDALGDGVDTNCDGGPEYDYDGDGFDGVAEGGADCDDTNPSVNPAAVDTCYDGVDTNCDDWDDDDCDLDGYASDAYGGDDCDDTRPGIHPGATDFPYDGVDDDCDGASEYDLDGDGHVTAWYGGDDCDDRDATVFPGAPDACYDGVDSDCGGGSDDDCDADGFTAAGAGGDDCDDADAAVSPGAEEIEGDGVDQNCDGSDFVLCADCDGDGFDAELECDDTDAAVYPGAPDAWYDGVDSDCDGADDYDADGDGADAIAWGGGDCDDADPAASPANTVDDCGGGDQDCDGETDEDCRLGDTGGTPADDTGSPRDTGPVIVDTDTRDTAEDWRPGPDALIEPDYIEQASGCGCATPGAPVSGLAGLAIVGLALVRRRR